MIFFINYIAKRFDFFLLFFVLFMYFLFLFPWYKFTLVVDSSDVKSIVVLTIFSFYR